MNKRIAVKKSKVQTRWFAFDLDANTNEWLAKQLAETTEVYDIVRRTKDHEGDDRQGYCISFDMVTLLKSSRGQFDFKFKIYKRQGRNGQIYPADFLDKKKKKLIVKKGDQTIVL
jgi:hypothetical protein